MGHTTLKSTLTAVERNSLQFSVDNSQQEFWFLLSDQSPLLSYPFSLLLCVFTPCCELLTGDCELIYRSMSS